MADMADVRWQTALSMIAGISSHTCFIGMQSFVLAWLFTLALFIFEIGFLMVLVIMRITT